MNRISLSECLDAVPVVAILRGITSDEIDAIAAAIFDAGIRAIEVPLNSPDPYASIERLAARFGEQCFVGAGTVLTVEQVDAVHRAGGRLVVSPNTNVDVIHRSVELGMTPAPGWATASDAFAAYQAGARYLKLFPASTYGSEHIRAMRAVLPHDARILAVGGIGAAHAAEWLAAGVHGFGIGSELYSPGSTSDDVSRRATRVVAAVQ